MRVLLQRAAHAKVTVAGEVTGEITRPGLVVFVGITHDDETEIAEKMARKTWELRIMDCEKSASDLAAPIMAISQFTLHASTRKGRRPSWNAAAPGPVSEPLFDAYVAALRKLGAEVATGVFGEQMIVELANDGPMTILMDSAEWGAAS